MKNKVKLRMCGLLFEYDVRLSVKLYFTKSYMNIRTSIGDRIFVWNNAYAFFIWKHKYTTIFMSMVRLFFVRNTFRIYL